MSRPIDVPRLVPSMNPASHARRNRYFHVVGNNVWEADEPAASEWHIHFIGMMGDVAVWAVDVPHGLDPADGASLDLFSFHGRNHENDWLAAGRAVQLVEWARTHRFCGRCGEATKRLDNERAMRCPACGLSAFPRLAPAIITLVTRGDGDDEEALLARGVQWKQPMYSCLAGFVEPGETLEEAVVRETLEEVGVTVGNVRYIRSQPWPFPHSLMLGFRADWLHGDIVCDPVEIADAQWFRRDEIPMIPPGISIARRLIDLWLAGGNVGA
ncbi:MAG: pyrophosphatase [Actinomycetota bacterium]|jgi:NAD+ diphosphatase